MLNDKLTILTPTFNRHSLLKRMLDYYSRYDFNVVVADGSSERFADVGNYKRLNYIYPEVPHMERFIAGVNAVQTPYLVLSPDDTLLSPLAMEKMVTFMEENPDYAGVEGYQASQYFSDNGYECKIAPMRSIDVRSALPSDRMFKVVAGECAFWRVWRLNSFKKIIDDLPHIELNKPYGGILTELAVLLAAGIVGKSMRLPLYFSLHEDIVSVNNNYRKGFSLSDFLTQPAWSDLYCIYVDGLSKMLVEQEGISTELAKTYVIRATEMYAPRMADKKKTIVDRIRNELRSLKRKTIGKKEHKEKMALAQKVAQAENEKRMQAMSEEEKQQMFEAADFIYKSRSNY